MSPLHAVHEGWETVTDATVRVTRGTIAGFIGGIFAAWVMNQYQVMENRKKPAGWSDPLPAPEASVEPFTTGASVAVAEQISRQVWSHDLTKDEKVIAGPVVQYGSSALAGAVYGALAELVPSVGRGFGIPYATMLWIGGDQLVMPALNLTPQPVETTPKNHISTVARRFVFGIALDISRRFLRRVL